ncbi:MAG: MFS transporter [Burkholderiales bacterium]
MKVGDIFAGKSKLTRNPRLMEGFKDSRAVVDFFWFLVAIFFCFLSYSALAPSAVILRESGLNIAQVGMTLSSAAVPILLATLVSGFLVARLGPLSVSVLGMLVMLVGHASLNETRSDFPAAMISTTILGVGLGLLMPAQMVFAKNLLTGPKGVYYFGIFASMLQLPNLFGPSLGEHIHATRGVAGYFLITAVPLALALGAVVVLGVARQAFLKRPPSESAGAARGHRYRDLMRDWSVMQPITAIGLIGFMYGFAPSYMALLLADSHLPVAEFFSTFSIFYFGTRFFVFPYLRSIAPPLSALTGVLGMTVAYALLVTGVSTTTVIVAGALFGLGYATTYPILSMWVANLFPELERAKPIALFNAVFMFGIYFFPIFGGYTLSVSGMSTLLAILCVVGVGTILLLGRAPLRRGLTDQLTALRKHTD